MQDADVKEPDYAFLARPALPARGATTDFVQQVLRDAIIASDLPPGSLINKHAICERLGVSRFPVSDALARLQAEGLVEILPQRGTRVTRIRMNDVRESMFIRRALETGAVSELAGHVGPETIATLKRLVRYQEAAVEAGDRRGFHALDLEFHEGLIDALGFPRAKAAIEAARSSLERARRILQSPRRHAVTLAEHKTILACLEAGDGPGASRAMGDHLDQVMAELAEFAGANPDIFETGG